MPRSSEDLRPGTNIRGDAAGAAWTYLLDSLEAGRVLFVGEPSEASRRTLERVATELVVTGPDLLAVSPGPYDLVCLDGRPAAGQAARMLAALVPRLGDHGWVYLEGRTGQALARTAQDLGLADVARYRMTPAWGEVETAVPVGDEVVGGWFRRRGITARRGGGPVSRLGRALFGTHDAARVGLFAARSPSVGLAQRRVPGYIQAIAARDGVDLSSYRFGLSARGRYGSRKVILYLFGPERALPGIVVKITRDPSHNDRLVNEERALRRVAETGLAERGTAPGVVFSGQHGGLQIVGETAIDGVLLTTGAAYRRGAPLAYRWLIELSARSAVRGTEGGPEIASALEAIVSGIDRIYGPEATEMEHLRQSARQVRAQIDRLPAVFMHGDAAAWNVLLTPDDRVAFLDWEAAEPNGFPLWDLFHFARSHILAASRLRRLARRPDALVRSMVEDEELRAAIRLYQDRLAIDDSLVGPLFRLCWAHRALREVSRLEESRLGEGHYLGLMRASLRSELDSAWTRPVEDATA